LGEVLAFGNKLEGDIGCMERRYRREDDWKQQDANPFGQITVQSHKPDRSMEVNPRGTMAQKVSAGLRKASPV
jgi:hypothetical protein